MIYLIPSIKTTFQILHLDSDHGVRFLFFEELVIDDQLRLREGDDWHVGLDHFSDVFEEQILVNFVLVQFLVHCGSAASSVHQMVVAALLIDAQITHLVLALSFRGSERCKIGDGERIGRLHDRLCSSSNNCCNCPIRGSILVLRCRLVAFLSGFMGLFQALEVGLSILGQRD